MPLIAIYDANILYAAPLRDLFVRLALTDIVQAKWTEAISDEWMRTLLRNESSLTRENVEHARDLMDRAVPGCLVAGWEALVETLALPDPKDRHVLAAAIQAHAAVIVTKNLRDFPEKVLKRYGVEAMGPDAFVMQALTLDADAVLGVLREQRSDLRNPPFSVEAFLDVLHRQGLPRTVARLRTLAGSL